MIRQLLSGALLAAALPALAAYPERPIRMIITAPAGGTIDFLARVIAPAMASDLGQQVVVDNRGGASGLLGADLVAKAAPDGYTILLTEHAALAVNAATRKDMPFDVAKDLVPLGLVATLPTMLAVHPSVPAATVKELVAIARREPRKLNYATPGVGTPHHLAATLLSRAESIEMTHVPYKGGGAMVTDVVAGQVPLLFTGVLNMMQFVRAGKLKAIAIGSPQRITQLPQVPTFAESGYPGFEVQVFFSAWVPARTPAEVAPALGRAVARALADPEVRRKLEEQTLVVIGSGPAELRAHFNREMSKWGELIRATGIVLE